MSKRKWIAATALAAGLTLAGGTVAQASTAGNYPTPTTTPTQPVVIPTVTPTVNCTVPTPRVYGQPGVDNGLNNGQFNQWNQNWGRHDRNRKCTQQEFDIQFSSLLPAVDANHDGGVLGTGPVNIVGGLDVSQTSPNVDLLETNTSGANSIRIHHQPLTVQFIDRATCSIDLAQFDLPWTLSNGTGRFAGATGSGLYNLTGQFSYPTRDNVCTLPVGLTPLRAAFILNYLNGAGLPTPLAVGIDVQAVGRAFVPSQLPVPTPTPTKTYWSPYGSPSA
jgi:hypothetical protein